MAEIGAAIAAWWGSLSALGQVMAVVYAASMVYSVAAAQKARRKARDAWNDSLRDRNVTIRSAVSPKTIVYGKANTGGTLVYAQATGDKSQRLFLVIAVAGHRVDGFESVYLDNEDILPLADSAARQGSRYNPLGQDNFDAEEHTVVNGTVTLAQVPDAVTSVNESNDFGGSGSAVQFTWTPGSAVVNVPGMDGQKVFVWRTIYARHEPKVYAHLAVGAPGQTAWSWLVDSSDGAWTSAHRGDNTAYVGLILDYDEDIFPSGIPPMKAIVRGKLCFDPRTGQTAWTDNPAIIARDYLMSPLGFGCPSSEIDDALIIAAANVCDQQVEVSPGAYQKRYTCNTLLSTETSPLENLDMILSSMAGTRSYSQGKWRIHAGAYTAPVMALNESMIVGPVAVMPRASRAELFNEVKGTYVEPAKGWEATDFPAVKNQTYVTQDGGAVLATDLALPCTIDPLVAQRIAKISLEQSRQALTVQATFNFSAYRVQPGDNVALTIGRYGFSSKAFKVIQRRFDPTVGVELLLREEAAASYDWNYGEATIVDPAPNTDLPNPYERPVMEGAITLSSGNAALLRLGDGTIISRIRVSWTASTDPRLTEGGHYELEFRQLGDDAWRSVPRIPGDGDTAYVHPVEDGKTYWIRIRPVNTLGVHGFWGYAQHTVIGKTAPPPALTGFSVSVLQDGTRRFSITAPTGVADGSQIVVRSVSGSSSNWAGMTHFFSLAYDDAVGTYTHETSLPLEGTWSFGAKLVDTTGNESSAVFIVGAALGTQPKRYDATFNLLKNADWTINVPNPGGYSYRDARLLPNWAYENGGGTDDYWGRNANNGTRYNIGPGGCYAAHTSVYAGDGRFTRIRQRVPVQANVAYEASVYVAVQYCAAKLGLVWYDASGNYIAWTHGGAMDTLSVTGLGTNGDPFDPMSWRRLFRYGTAPANAAFADIIIEKGETNAGVPSGTNSYAYFHKSMVCRHGGGSTPAEALPWVPSFAVDPGEVTTVGLAPSAATEVYTAQSSGTGDAFWDEIIGAGASVTLAFSNQVCSVAVPVEAGDELAIHVNFDGNASNAPAYAQHARVAIDVDAGTGFYFRRSSGGTGNLAWREEGVGPNTTKCSLSLTSIYRAVAAQTVTVYGGGGACFGNGNGTYTESGKTTLRVERIKR